MEKLPAYHEFEEFKLRRQKLQEIQEIGINPYPPKYTISALAEELHKRFEGQEVGHSDDAAAGTTPSASISGRLVLFRAMGKNAFAQIQDSSGRIQVMFNRDLTTLEGYSLEGNEAATALKFIEKKIDLGDILGVEGTLFRTQKGELTLFASKVTLLCKVLLPLPDKHSGLADKGTRYRKRWLDLIANREVVDTFILRSKVLRLIRNYFEEADFLEVETPVLQNTYGGAEAQPFITHLNALHQNMYLRISLEIPLKKLIVGGMGKVYEIGKVFRNEGIDKTHNPEFTELEAYATNWDYRDMMRFMENLFEIIALKLFGTTEIRFENPEEGSSVVVNLKAPWIRMTMKESLKSYAKIDVDLLSEHEMRQLVLKEGSEDPKDVEKATRGQLIAMLFSIFSEPHLIQPHHIIDHPIETTPLCKPHRDPASRQEGLVERFESFILGSEMANSYTELNDPILQRELLEKQAAKKLGENPLDEEFIEAICQGMPPTAGIGMGIDRLVMLFAKATSIRDVLFFPLIRHDG